MKLATPDSKEYQDAKTNLNSFSNILKRDIRLAKSKYYHDRLNKFKSDSRKTWNIINDILWRKKSRKEFPKTFLLDGKEITDKHEIAEKFNSFFTNIGPTFSNKIPSIPNKSFRTYLTKHIISTFSFSLVDQKIVYDTIKDIATKTSCGFDNLSTSLLKKIFSSVCPILTITINQSLSTGIFPVKLKIAKVLPLYKKGKDDIFDNYRPISLLPAISKVFEKIVFKQLYDYFLTKKLIYNSQYGFRTLHSTELAALELCDRVVSDLDDGEIPIAIFLDLSKAFDTLDHNILLSKLEYYGVSGTALNWFSSYLTGRAQYVHYDGVDSSLSVISTGVPQGSILGPLLFLIYMNDIAEASEKFHSILYADDTTLEEPLSSFELVIANKKADIKKVSKNINNELQAIYEWLCVNKLSLNIPKTKFMIFHHRQRKIDHLIPTLKISNHQIERVKYFDFLGITIDEHMSWNMHIQKISNKISRNLGCLNRLKRFLPLNTRKLLYNSLILPHLQYGILSWGFECKRVFKLQKRAMRIVSLSKYNAHTDPIFKKLKILQIKDLFNVSLLKFQFKLEKDRLPHYFTTMFEDVSVSHSYGLRHRDDERKPKHNCELIKKTIRYHLPVFINTMPSLIIDKINTHSEKGFAHYAKTKFIDNYSSICNIRNCYICS